MVSQYLRKISACLLVAGFLGVIVGGCRPPWKSDVVVVDVPPVNRGRIRLDAIIALRQAAGDDIPSTRFIALEVIPEALGTPGGAICKQALDDPCPEVRITAAMGIGDLRYAPAKEKLLGMVQYKVKGAERDVRVYCAAIYALHQLGDTTYTTNLGEALFDRENEVRATVALVMGKMGHGSAISPLKSALADERDHGMRFELRRALARCGERSSQRRLEAYTRDQFVDEQIMAVRAMLELKSKMCRTIFTSLVARDKSPRVKTVAAGGLAALGYETQPLFAYCVQAALEPRRLMEGALDGRSKPTDQQIHFLQSLAATALGEFKHPQALDVVGQLLKNSDPGVRVAAAASILKVLPKGAIPEETPKKKKVKVVAEPKTKPAFKRPELHTSGARE
ncbi:MAG: HEAT repeat domain-containing protein [bacterium]|nr:HEAT repeat domain-containing protein [bacterium]